MRLFQLLALDSSRQIPYLFTSTLPHLAACRIPVTNLVMSWMPLRRIGPLVGLFFFVFAGRLVLRQLDQFNLAELSARLADTPMSSIFAAFALTIVSYLTMVGYDWIGFRYIEQKLSLAKVAMTSFMGYAFSLSLGFPLLTGAPVRYRFYTLWGIPAADVARLIAFITVSLVIGLFSVGGVLFTFFPIDLPSFLHIPVTSPRVFGILLLVPVTIYLAWARFRHEPISLGKISIPVPTFRLSVLQILFSSLDWILAGVVLYVLLPERAAVGLPLFFAAYLLAQISAISSQVPAGLGVFEAVMLFFLTPVMSSESVVGALMLYRGIYYLFPLITAILCFFVAEAVLRRKVFLIATGYFGRVTALLTPHVLAILAFLAGCIILASSIFPASHHQIAWLYEWYPGLALIEFSHFLGSIAGVALLIVARGLQRRLDAAYHLTMFCLTAGIALFVFKGQIFPEVTFLSVAAALLIPARKQFHRTASLFGERFSVAWVAAILAVVISTLGLGFFVYRNVEYSGTLWWSFALSGDAPRFLRGSVGILSTVLIFGLAKLLRPSAFVPLRPSREELDLAEEIIRENPHAHSHLALLGDKALLFSESRRAFLMYAVEGRSWVAYGDPIGPEAERAELAWRFREMCDRYHGWPVFYQVRPENLPLYLDMGFSLLKLGEEARVLLEDFTMEGSDRAGLRRVVSRMERAGCTFEMLEPHQITSLLPELREVSDSWLANKGAEEKAFSLGYFDESYLQRGPMAVLRLEGRIVAFASLMHGGERQEISVDLMRYTQDLTWGVMDYLFVRLILWAKEDGYTWFNLGMAPLSGMESRPQAPMWNHVASLVFQHGDHFYSFQGLRRYKEKFNPVWSPKYLASPGGIALPVIFANISSLINSGRSDSE